MFMVGLILCAPKLIRFLETLSQNNQNQTMPKTQKTIEKTITRKEPKTTETKTTETKTESRTSESRTSETETADPKR